MESTTKTAAAVAAVLQYIRTEEEAIAMQSAMQEASQAQMLQIVQPPAPVAKPWGASGRQAQMQIRNLMQLRTFRKL
jgi:hypothetical protein